MNLSEKYKKRLLELAGIKPNISDVIKEVAAEFMYENQCSLKDINSGMCPEFADEVIERMGGYSDNLDCGHVDQFYDEFGDQETGWNEIRTKNGATWSKDMLDKYGYPPIPLDDFHMGHHQWIIYNGRHYDAETPNGVKTPWELLFYKRQIHDFLNHNK